MTTTRNTKSWPGCLLATPEAPVRAVVFSILSHRSQPHCLLSLKNWVRAATQLHNWPNTGRFLLWSGHRKGSVFVHGKKASKHLLCRTFSETTSTKTSKLVVDKSKIVKFVMVNIHKEQSLMSTCIQRLWEGTNRRWAEQLNRTTLNRKHTCDVNSLHRMAEKGVKLQQEQRRRFRNIKEKLQLFIISNWLKKEELNLHSQYKLFPQSYSLHTALLFSYISHHAFDKQPKGEFIKHTPNLCRSCCKLESPFKDGKLWISLNTRTGLHRPGGVGG